MFFKPVWMIHGGDENKTRPLKPLELVKGGGGMTSPSSWY